MDLRSIYISNGIGIVLLLVLGYVSRTKVQRRHTEDKLYTFMVVGVMIACVMEAFSYAVDEKVFFGSRILNYIANTYLFTMNLMLPFALMIYIDLSLYKDKSRIWKKYKVQIAVGLVMVLFTLINFITPIVYSISPENKYARGPVSYAYYFVIIYYVICAAVTTHRFEKDFGTRTFFSIELFIVPILAGTTLQFIFYGLSLAWLSSAVGLTGLYMMQQNETAYIDPLTDLYNRQYMNHTVSYWKDKGYVFSGVMIDLDWFKHINDTLGHSEGDRALIATANMLKAVCHSGEIPFRFAGDEFIVLVRTDNGDDLERIGVRLEQAVAEYNSRSKKSYKLSLSYGFSTFRGSDVDAFMREMDANMYGMKRCHHAKEDGGSGS